LATVTKAIKSAIKPEPINSAIILSAYVPMPHAIPFRDFLERKASRLAGRQAAAVAFD